MEICIKEPMMHLILFSLKLPSYPSFLPSLFVSGLGAVWNTCKVEASASVAVFGLGAVVSTCI